MPTTEGITIERTGGEDLSDGDIREEVRDLLTDADGPVTAGHGLCYVCVAFKRGSVDLRDKKRLVSELENATDVRASQPELDHLSTADTSLHLLLVTPIRPELVADALVYDFIDSVSVWEIDPESANISVSDQADKEDCDRAAIFSQLQRETVNSGGETPPEIRPDDSTSDPKRVQFSEDEMAFEDLLAIETGEDDQAVKTTRSESSEQQQSPLVTDLVAELEAGRATPDEIACLRDHLVQSESRASLEVRLEHVQARMDNFAAYADALEEFLDDHGTAQQLLTEFQNDVRELHDELETAATERRTLTTRLDEIEQSHQQIDQIETRLESIETALDDLEQWRHRIETAIVE